MAGPAALSYSSIHTYLECPLRWKFLYVDRLPETPRGYFSFGRSVHSVLEELLRPFLRPVIRKGAQGEQRTLEEFGPGPRTGVEPIGPEALLHLLDRRWIRDGYESPEEEERYRELGRQILLRYREGLVASPPTPVAVEAHLEATWEGVPLHGYVDRIDLLPSGGLEIVDYKTGRGLTAQDAIDSSQLAIYQVLVERNFAHPVESLALIDLRNGHHLPSPPRTQPALDDLRGDVLRVYDGIRDQSYEPTPGRICSRCEFQSLCPVFREVPSLEKEKLQGLVDRFASLRDREAELDAELRRAAQALHAEAERLGVHRIPGSMFTAVRRREVTRKPAAAGPGRTVPITTVERNGPVSSRWFWELETASRPEPRNRPQGSRDDPPAS